MYMYIQVQCRLFGVYNVNSVIYNYVHDLSTDGSSVHSLITSLLLHVSPNKELYTMWTLNHMNLV